MNIRTTPVPPLYEIEIEQALIGAVMSANRLYWQVAEIIAADDFYDPMHGKVWEAIAANLADDRPADARMITAALRLYVDETKAQDANRFDVAEYLRTLSAAGSHDANVKSMARAVGDLARRRRVVEQASEAINAAYYDRETSPEVIAERAVEAIYDVTRREGQGSGPEPLIDVIRRAADAAEVSRLNPNRARITTGLASVDAQLGGFFPRDLHILGAASSMGKSGLVGQFSLAASRAGYVVLVFSIEMASEEFATRFLAVDSGVPANRIAEGRTSAAETSAIAEATQQYFEAKFFLDGSSNLSMAQIRARAQAVRRRHERVDLIVIDHLRLVRAADARAPEPQRLDQMTQDAKAIAKDLNAAVLVIAPVNRELWKREAHRPIISDLYGASAIEYNADHVWFLHREEFYLEREKPEVSNNEAYGKWLVKSEAAKGLAEVFGAKRRGGPLGSAMLDFIAPLVQFKEREQPSKSEPQERFL